jgi:hypothetical protein
MAGFAGSGAGWQNLSVAPPAIRTRPVRPTAAAAILMLLLSSCTVPQPVFKIPVPSCPHVPPPPSSKPPKPPLSALPQVLQPGHWEWDTSGYVWQKPHWQVRLTKRPPVWLDGFWEPNGGACVWHNGRFLHGPGVK